jgi:hypothetical protein
MQSAALFFVIGSMSSRTADRHQGNMIDARPGELESLILRAASSFRIPPASGCPPKFRLGLNSNWQGQLAPKAQESRTNAPNV